MQAPAAGQDTPCRLSLDGGAGSASAARLSPPPVTAITSATPPSTGRVAANRRARLLLRVRPGTSTPCPLRMPAHPIRSAVRLSGFPVVPPQGLSHTTLIASDRMTTPAGICQPYPTETGSKDGTREG